MNQTNKNAAAKSGKGRPTPSTSKKKAAANAAAARKAKNQWIFFAAVIAVCAIAGVVLYSVFSDAVPLYEEYQNNGLRAGQ